MVKDYTIQIQSVLYRNDINDLKKAALGIVNAIRVAREEDKINISAVLCYGDASPEKLFTDELVEEWNREFKGEMTLKYKAFGFNSGTAKGHNILGSECTSEYMMIMNPDVIVSPRLFVEEFRLLEDDKVGMVEARQTPVEHPKYYDPETFETEWASTACVIFPTRVFNELKGFDEVSFFMYCDDLDFSWRMRLLGYKILYQPIAPAYHAKHLSGSGAWQPTSAEIFYSADANIMMAYKYSNDQLLDRLIKQYSGSGMEEQVKAVESFNKRKAENKLVPRLDPEHRIAKFVGNYYTEHRYEL